MVIVPVAPREPEGEERALAPERADVWGPPVVDPLDPFAPGGSPPEHPAATAAVSRAVSVHPRARHTCVMSSSVGLRGRLRAGRGRRVIRAVTGTSPGTCDLMALPAGTPSPRNRALSRGRTSSARRTWRRRPLRQSTRSSPLRGLLRLRLLHRGLWTPASAPGLSVWPRPAGLHREDAGHRRAHRVAGGHGSRRLRPRAIRRRARGDGCRVRRPGTAAVPAAFLGRRCAPPR